MMNNVGETVHSTSLQHNAGYKLHNLYANNSKTSLARTVSGSASSSALKDVKQVLLTIQLDALATLVDEQATRRLWKLFTNCAGSIAHGRRLENLSWRTWGRDQSVLRHEPTTAGLHLQHKTSNGPSNESFDSPNYQPTERDHESSPSVDSITTTLASNGRRRSSSTQRSSSSPQRPSYRRFDSNASTAISGSIAVSRSPPLGQLIKRVIFTPPDDVDIHNRNHYSEEVASSQGLRGGQDREDNVGDRPVSSREEETSLAAVVTTPNINSDSHVAPTTSQSSTTSQTNGPRILIGQTVDEPQPEPRVQTTNTNSPFPFPTVVISQSTPKPTPPDTPARSLSPTAFQALTPLHALSLTHALSPNLTLSNPNPILAQPHTPSISTSNSTTSSSTISSFPSAPRPMLETLTMAATRIPVEQMPNQILANVNPDMATSTTAGNFDAPAPAHVSGNINANGSGVTKFSDSSSPAGSRSGSLSTANRVPISTQTGPAGPSHPRMFFLQRESNSFSPESNSRSNSHSRSPASPTQSHRRHDSNSRSSDARSPSHSRSPDSRNGNGVKPAIYAHVTSRHAEAEPSVKSDAVMDDSGEVGTRRPRRSEGPARAESRVAAVDQPVQINEDSASQPSVSPHNHTPAIVSSTRSQRLMARSRRVHRAHLGRALDRASSRSRPGFKGSEGSFGSRGSGAPGSLDANVGSASVSGMGSVSTSSSSKLVMGRLNRAHQLSSQTPLDKETTRPASQSPLSRELHSNSQPMRQVSPLAVLPDPIRMEVLEQQVVQSNIRRQSGGGQRRTIALESDSEEDDESFDEDASDDNQEDVVEVKRGSSQEKSEQVVEDEDGSSWSDEDEVVVVPAKRTQTTAPAPPPARRESHEHQQEKEQAGSESSGRHAVHFPAQKAVVHLPHVKSKPKLSLHHQHHRAISPPPPARQQPARKGPAPHQHAHANVLQAHGRISQSSEGLLAKAAREAQRQQDMFVPLPRESYSSTNLVREKSLTSLSRGGRPSALTLLLNPDPYWFPQGHPYRESPRDPMDPKLSRSMEEIHARNGNGSGMRSPRPGTGLGFGGLRMTSTNAIAAPPNRRDSAPASAVAKAAATVAAAPSPAPQPKPRHSPPKTSKSPPGPSKLRPSKSSMAVPVVLGVTASSAPRDEKKPDMLEMSLRQMGARQQRAPRHQSEAVRPSIAHMSTQSSDKSKESNQSGRGNRLRGRPADVELSDSEDEESPKMKDAVPSGRSLAQEHLAAVMGGKDPTLVKSGLSASRTILASPDAPPPDSSRPVESASYRPPAPPSSPSIYNPYEAKRAQGHLPHTPTPPSTARPPTARTNRPRPHSSHGQLLTAIAPAPGPSMPTPTREGRQPAISQPPVPVSIEPTRSAEVPWPYNLPYPAPVQSPRTTRLKMLAAEVPDDLRKDLLWERKTNRIVPILNNNVPVPIRRGANLKPLTTLRPEGSEPRDESDESDEAMRDRLQREHDAKERYDKMRTRTWNGVIYQRPVW